LSFPRILEKLLVALTVKKFQAPKVHYEVPKSTHWSLSCFGTIQSTHL
jgi:hypothetical protein